MPTAPSCADTRLECLEKCPLLENLPESREGIAPLLGVAKSWWKLTADADYLRGIASRRRYRKMFIPFLVVFLFATDSVLYRIETGLHMKIIPILSCCMMASLSVLPSTKLRWDSLGTCSAVAQSVTWMVTIAGDLESDMLTHVMMSTTAYWISILIFIAAVHPVYVFAYVLLLPICMAASSWPILSCLITAIFGFALACSVGFLEWFVASLSAENREKSAIVKTLIEDFSDGVCTVDTSTGVLRSANAKFKTALDIVCSVEGQSLSDFVKKPEDKDTLKELLRNSRCGHFNRLKPVMMMLEQSGGDFLLLATVCPVSDYAMFRSNPKADLQLAIRINEERHYTMSNGKDMRTWSVPMHFETATACPETDEGHPDCSVADVSFATSWANEAVHVALLAPRNTEAKQAKNIKQTAEAEVQTDAIRVGDDGDDRAVVDPPKLNALLSPPNSPGLELCSPDNTLDPGKARQNFLDGPANLPPGMPKKRPTSRGSRSRRSRSGSGSSFSESVASSAGRINLSVASCFIDTTLHTRRKSIIIAMHHWNLQRDPESCCPWHHAVRAVEEVAQLEKRTPCKPLWSPFLGWQCTQCTGLNYKSVEPCNVCGADKPSSPDLAKAECVPPAPPESSAPS